MKAMMLFQQAQHRAKATQDHAKASQDQEKVTNKLPLEEEKENDATQREVQELQRMMEPKRARTQSPNDDDDEECSLVRGCGRGVHRDVVSRYRAVEEEVSRVGSQGLVLGEARCVGLCADSDTMVH